MQTEEPQQVGDAIERLPEQAQRLLSVLRWCVIGLWVLGGIIFFLEPLAALPVIILAMCGTAVLSEDRVMKHCYGVLTRVFGEACRRNGVPMLPPVFTVALMNSVLHAIQIIRLCVLYFSPVHKDNEEKFHLWAALLIGGVWVCETVTAVVSLRIMKLVVAESAAADVLEGYQRLPAGIAPPPRVPGFGAALAPAGPAGGTAAAAAQQGIVPFSGRGFKMGD